MGLPWIVVPLASTTCFLNSKAPSHLPEAQPLLATLLSPQACLPRPAARDRPAIQRPWSSPADF